LCFLWQVFYSTTHWDYSLCVCLLQWFIFSSVTVFVFWFFKAFVPDCSWNTHSSLGTMFISLLWLFLNVWWRAKSCLLRTDYCLLHPQCRFLITLEIDYEIHNTNSRPTAWFLFIRSIFCAHHRLDQHQNNSNNGKIAHFQQQCSECSVKQGPHKFRGHTFWKAIVIFSASVHFPASLSVATTLLCNPRWPRRWFYETMSKCTKSC